MRTEPATLRYATPEAAVREHRLVDDPDQCSFTLPSVPLWLAWLGIGGAILAGGAMIGMFAYMAYRFAGLMGGMGLGTWDAGVAFLRVTGPVALNVLLSAGYIAVALMQIRGIRRWGLTPRRFELSAGILTDTRPGLFYRPVRRTYTVEEIRYAAVQPVKSIVPRHRVAKMVLKVGRWRSIGASIPDRAIPLAQQFVARVQEAMERSRVPKDPGGTR